MSPQSDGLQAEIVGGLSLPYAILGALLLLALVRATAVGDRGGGDRRHQRLLRPRLLSHRGTS